MSDLAKITRSAPRGMITFRGNLGEPAIKNAIKAAIGAVVPDVGKMTGDSAGGVLWMSPDEVLLMVPYASVQGVIAKLNASLSQQHVLLADVSDARAVFRIEGALAAQVLARLCPVDLHKDAFAIGDLRRTRIAQIAAAFWRDATGFEVVCFRSVEDYAATLLGNAAQGTKVAVLDH